ncbi:461_t:CDS:2 [Ambispora leptoticha]|uniref:461_t:CDS:1 n=1 Tax=Ambispora leptoticha TaxID=144679 RepID=A0A9N9AX07_9GLOM|nr:461_t:CDS:2 [Ambispora leptoticha]
MSQYKRFSLLQIAIVALFFLFANAEDCGTQNPNGKCNASAGECCSKWGYCGVGDAWCGAGCQPNYGLCSSTTSSTTSTSSRTSNVEADMERNVLQINVAHNGVGVEQHQVNMMIHVMYALMYYIYRYLIVVRNLDYCAAGCQSGFGNCNSASTTTTSTTTTSTTTSSSSTTSKSTTTSSTTTTSSSYPTSTNDQCGKDHNTQCPSGNCCSQWGWCGTTSDYCGSGCQSGFGKCNNDPSTTSTTTSASPTQTGTGGGPVTAKVYSSCAISNTFAITFDDGPYSFTNELLDTLANKGIKATFFVNGNNWGCIYDYADVVKRAYDEGHQIAAHTWSHPSLPSLSDDDIRYQITALETALRKIIGAVPRFFRLPYGDGSSDSRVLGILGDEGYSHIIQWDIDSGDSTGNTPDQSKQVYLNNVNPPNPHVALNHDVKQTTVEDVAPYAIDLIKGDGYNMMTVGDCLGTSSWYKEVTSPSSRDSSWTC